MASAVAPPTTSKTTTSAPSDPLYQQAVAQAKAALSAEQAPIQAEQKASDAAYTQRQTDATDNAAALSDLLKGIGPQVSGMYNTAAQTQGLLANGFSQGMKDALQGNTDNLNAMLSKLGSPAKLDSHAQQAGDVTYGLGGYIPGQTFSREGAAFGAAADMLPGTALLKGQEQVKALSASAIEADKGFQNKLAEMAGKLPGDIQTNYQHLQTLALQNAKFREQVSKDKFDEAAKTAEIKLAQAKYGTDVAYKSAQLKLSAQRLAQQQYNADRSYQLRLANLGIAEKKLQLTVMENSFKAANGGLSRKEVSKFTSEAQSIAMQGLNGYTTYTTKSGVKTPQHVGQVSYFEALQQGLKKGIPVQIVLDSLDRVYPAQYRPTDDQLAQQLGPLDPNALAGVRLGEMNNALPSAGFNMTHPVKSLIGPTPPQQQQLKNMAFKLAADQGWYTSDQLQALDQLWTRESGWNPSAKNPSSGALGIPQELGHSVPKDYASNPLTQLKWGLNYIKQRYGSPAAAWAHEQQVGWY